LSHGSAGEGTVVQLVARMTDAHIADCGGREHGELVNCDFLGVKANDIHIELMSPTQTNATPCDSVGAEMIPHFRPDAWQMLDQKTPVSNPVRVTGPLFYDDSHQPCVGKKTASPPRRTVWEVHPVYALDVCTSSNEAQCDPLKAAMWDPYDKWVQQPGAVVKATDGKSSQNPLGARAACNALSNNQPIAPPLPKRGGE
jgi:hypothetical protein